MHQRPSCLRCFSSCPFSRWPMRSSPCAGKLCRHGHSPKSAPPRIPSSFWFLAAILATFTPLRFAPEVLLRCRHFRPIARCGCHRGCGNTWRGLAQAWVLGGPALVQSSWQCCCCALFSRCLSFGPPFLVPLPVLPSPLRLPSASTNVPLFRGNSFGGPTESPQAASGPARAHQRHHDRSQQ